MPGAPRSARTAVARAVVVALAVLLAVLVLLAVTREDPTRRPAGAGAAGAVAPGPG